MSRAVQLTSSPPRAYLSDSLREPPIRETSVERFARRILILFAHPALEKSRVNRVLIEAVQDLPGVTFQDLYEEYPDFDVDIEREQRLLLEHDLVVLQHPLFWYSTPALLKEWQDLVLQHGWAYGSSGTALAGKEAMSVITTGARKSAFRVEGSHHCTMTQLLTPLQRTFELCNMTYLSPFLVHGTLRMQLPEMERYGRDYRAVLLALRDGRDLSASAADGE